MQTELSSRTLHGASYGWVFRLVILKEAAAPLSGQPWFRELVEQTGNSLLLAFAVAALLTIIVQSSGAVSVFGISLAEVGVVSVDQAIMIIYGSFVGSSVILYALSASLTGRSRQVVMYMVILNILICAIVVPLLYCEIYFGLPSMKAFIFATGLDLDQQLALVVTAHPILASRLFADCPASPDRQDTHAALPCAASGRPERRVTEALTS